MILNKKTYLTVLCLIFFIAFSCMVACSKNSIEIQEFKVEVVTEEITEEVGEENLTEEVEKAEEVIEVEEVEDPILKKLDEIQDQYSLEFRQYLESQEKNYLENILNDDDALKREYELFDWKNIFYDEEIIFTADKDIFPSSWYDPEIYAKAESLSEDEIERSKSIIASALDKYPVEVLKDSLKSVYILKSMNFYGVDYGGTNSEDYVYMVNNGEDMGYSDFYIEETFHHEFSSVLLRKYNELFDESEWRQINPGDFEYFDEAIGGASAIREGRASKEFDPKFHEMGFLYEYAQSALENDFNSFAENIFMGDESFFKTVEEYEKLKMKLGLVIEFYNTINQRFNIEYFKGI